MNYKLSTYGGNHFESVAKEAKRIAQEKKTNVEFSFNGVSCIVDKKTNIDLLYRDYSNSWTMEWRQVGPICVKKYSREVQSILDERLKLEEEKAQIERDNYRKKADQEENSLNEIIGGIEIELLDIDGWNKSKEDNNNGYGKAALDYAEAWAKKMQMEIANGKTVADCYDYTQNGLGFLGITGFQFGCAVSILSQTWKHGKELRVVHNKKYGIKEEIEGAVNPALMTMSL